MVEFNYTSNLNARTADNNANQYKTVQAWKSRKAAPQAALNPIKTTQAQNQILANLEKASKGQIGTFDIQLETSSAYANAGQRVTDDSNSQSAEGFQFADVIDVINPLQHLPVVSMIYRSITGDELHPMAQIIGGALYGGPIGAVTGTANAISQIQTGKDLGEHALGLVGIGNNKNNFTDAKIDKNNPEAQLNNAADAIERSTPLDELPGSALSFVNLSEPHKGYERIKIADGRTAGSMIVKKQMIGYRQSINSTPIMSQKTNEAAPITNFSALPVREEITSVSLSAMPPKQGV